MLLQELFQFFKELFTTLFAFFHDHKGLGDRAFVWIGNADHTRFSYRRVLLDGLFHLSRTDAVAGTLDHVVFAGYEADVAIILEKDSVSHLIPAIDHALLLRLEQPFVFYIRLPVEGTRGTFENHAADLVGLAIITLFINDPHLDAGQRFADGIWDGLRIHGVGCDEMEHLSAAESFPDGLAGKFLPPFQSFGTEGITTRGVETH